MSIILHLFRRVAASHSDAIPGSRERSCPGIGPDFSIF